MPKNEIKIRFPASTADRTLKPGNVGFRQFAAFTVALSDVVESIVSSAKDEVGEEPEEGYAVNFAQIGDESIDWILAIPLILLPYFEPLVPAFQNRDLSRLDPTTAIKVVEAHKFARRNGWNWGIELGPRKEQQAQIPASEEIKLMRTTFRYAAKLRGTIISIGNIDTRVRFRLMNGKTYSSRIPRHLAQKLTTYVDYMISGEAIADAQSLDVIDFKVRDAEQVTEGDDLDGALKRLAQTATREFITTDTAKFFEDED